MSWTRVEDRGSCTTSSDRAGYPYPAPSGHRVPVSEPSKRSAQRCAPLVASINCAVMRTRPPCVLSLPGQPTPELAAHLFHSDGALSSALAALTGVEPLLQQSDRTAFGISAKNEAHDFRLAFDDDELAVSRLITERRHAHPHPLLFRGSDLVPDPLTNDL